MVDQSLMTGDWPGGTDEVRSGWTGGDGIHADPMFLSADRLPLRLFILSDGEKDRGLTDFREDPCKLFDRPFRRAVRHIRLGHLPIHQLASCFESMNGNSGDVQR